MFSNDTIKYISYGIMIFIILTLISNIYIIKINNNYRGSGLIEGMENKKSDTKKSDTKKSDTKKSVLDDDVKKSIRNIDIAINDYCKNNKEFKDNKDKILDLIPKLKGLYTYNMANDIGNIDTNISSLDGDIMMISEKVYMTEELLQCLDLFESKFKYLDFDCGK